MVKHHGPVLQESKVEFDAVSGSNGGAEAGHGILHRPHGTGFHPLLMNLAPISCNASVWTIEAATLKSGSLDEGA